jgi:hypothetical protein
LGRLFPYGAGESIPASSPQRVNEPDEDKAVAATTASATGVLAVSVNGAAAAADPIVEKTEMVGTIIDDEAVYAASTSDLAPYRAGKPVKSEFINLSLATAMPQVTPSSR